MIGLIIAGFVARQILKAKITAAVHTANAVMNLPETLDKANRAAESKRETAAEAAREASDPQYKALKLAERAKAHAEMLEELEQIRRRVLERDRERERQKAEEEKIRIERERKAKALARAEFMILFSCICLLCYFYNTQTPHQDVQAPAIVSNQNSDKNNPDIANHEYIDSNPSYSEQNHLPVDAGADANLSYRITTYGNTEQNVVKQSHADSIDDDGSKNMKVQIGERDVKPLTDADSATAISTGTGNSSDVPGNLDNTTQPPQSRQKYSHDNGNGTVSVYVDNSSGQVVPEGAPNSHSETFIAGTEPTKLSPKF